MRAAISTAIIGLGVLLVLYLPALKVWNTNTETVLANLFIEGRAHIENDEVRLSFPGSQLRLATPSTHMSLDFDETRSHADSAFDYKINDGAWQTHYIGGQSRLDLSSDTGGKGIEFHLIRRSEAWQGDIIFVGAQASDGFIQPTPFPKTKLLFIGDSITAGAGTQSRVNATGEREAVSNARLAYPRVLGERLNTQVHQIAYGGRGLVRDWQGITNTNNAPQFYDRVLPDNPDHIWDHADYPADIVSVMLGTNDFNTDIPERDNWTQSYVTFVERIRTDYPNAQVFLISSPMTGGEKGDTLKSYVSEVAASFDTPQVKYLEVSQYYGEPWDSHPTAAEHEKIADELEPHFRVALEATQ